MLNLSYYTMARAWRRYAGQSTVVLAETLGLETSGAVIRRNGAVIASLALIACGVAPNGDLTVASGDLKGARLFNGANGLAEWLESVHKAPEIIAMDDGLMSVARALFGRRALVVFVQGNGPSGGYIGLADGSNGAALCQAAETCHPLEVRLWELH